MKTFASLLSALFAAVVAAFVGAAVGALVWGLVTGFNFATLPLFGGVGAALFAVWGAFKGFARGASAPADVVGSDASSFRDGWASDDVVDTGATGIEQILLPFDFDVPGDNALLGGRDD